MQVYRATDGGVSWETIKIPNPDPEPISFDDMSWVPANKGYLMLGSGGGWGGNEIKALYYSNNGGKSWI
jgi:photosystem II stability/assembly factor-like uncharacterized protein